MTKIVYEDEWITKNRCICLGTGKATIEIEKEWNECKGKGKIPKYKVGDDIYISEDMVLSEVDFKEYNEAYNNVLEMVYIKCKILSETEDKYKVVMVR